jgi:UDP-GlcNAc:undecaprenyl-phosphate GlcNAc-1-phosphate transferase
MPYSLELALASGALTLAITPAARALAVRVGALDHPGPRRVHAVATPRFGGLAMAFAVLSVAWIARVLPGPARELDARPLLGLTCASLPMLALGVIDDLGHVGPWVKLLVQACAALTLTVFGFGVPLLTNPFGEPIVTGLWSLPLTVVWVVALTNAINLIDGLDGLATGVVAIACGALWMTGRGHGDFYVMFLAAILLGACAGFLGWNRPPARIFMGDTGSQFLGLTLSAVSLLENRKGTAALTLLLPLVALGVPLADGMLAFVRRALRGQPVFRGDAGHIHHRLLDAGLSPPATLAVLWGLSAMFGGAAILLDRLPHAWTALVVGLLAVVLFAVLFAARHRARTRQRQGS